MVGWISKHRYSPIGLDIGSRSVKLLQFDATRSGVHEAARWDLATVKSDAAPQREQQIVDAIGRAREGRNFRGREAVLCLGAEDLFVQNIRVAPASGDELKKIVHFEAAGRVPFSSDEAEIRFFEAADVRQGDTVIIEKAGEIIPQVVEVKKQLRPAGARAFTIPENCPNCGRPAVKDTDGVYIRCTNAVC